MNNLIEGVCIHADKAVLKGKTENSTKSRDTDLWHSMFDSRILTVRNSAQSYTNVISLHRNTVNPEPESMSDFNVKQVAESTNNCREKPKCQLPNWI